MSKTDELAASLSAHQEYHLRQAEELQRCHAQIGQLEEDCAVSAAHFADAWAFPGSDQWRCRCMYDSCMVVPLTNSPWLCHPLGVPLGLVAGAALLAVKG